MYDEDTRKKKSLLSKLQGQLSRSKYTHAYSHTHTHTHAPRHAHIQRHLLSSFNAVTSEGWIKRVLVADTGETIRTSRQEKEEK